EPWIIKEVINWLRDRNSFDYLEEVFIKAPKRAVPTEDQERKAVRDFYVVNHVDKIIAEKNIGVRAACRELVIRIVKSDERYYLLWDTTNEKHGSELEEAIREVYNNAKKKTHRHYPPYPYYGRDIEVDENGKVTIFGGR
ncbi:hypothetical protein KAR10_09965, partial [bacterium]|nr:hypothetical protein [bacterium]